MAQIKFPSIQNVADLLAQEKKRLCGQKAMVSVRLRVHEGGWEVDLYEGQPTDYNKGFYGVGDVTAKTNCRTLAKTMIAQAKADYDLELTRAFVGLPPLAPPEVDPPVAPSAEGENSPDPILVPSVENVSSKETATVSPSLPEELQGLPLIDILDDQEETEKVELSAREMDDLDFYMPSAEQRTKAPSAKTRSSYSPSRGIKGEARAYRKALKRLGLSFPLRGAFTVVGSHGNALDPNSLSKRRLIKIVELN